MRKSEEVPPSPCDTSDTLPHGTSDANRGIPESWQTISKRIYTEDYTISTLHFRPTFGSTSQPSAPPTFVTSACRGTCSEWTCVDLRSTYVSPQKSVSFSVLYTARYSILWMRPPLHTQPRAGLLPAVLSYSHKPCRHALPFPWLSWHWLWLIYEYCTRRACLKISLETPRPPCQTDHTSLHALSNTWGYKSLRLIGVHGQSEADMQYHRQPALPQPIGTVLGGVLPR